MFVAVAWCVLGAWAGDVYLNGIRADVLPVMSMENVTVRFDAQGNIWVDAPTYRVRVSTGDATIPSNPASALAPPPPPAPRVQSGVAAGSWWLVTEDNDSVGHDVAVAVNGVSVQRVRSGEGQLILDLGAWLQRGTNTITMTAAPGSYAGGALMVYVGKGGADEGTVRLEAPDIRYARRAVDLGSGATRSYTLVLP
ncbi:MAG: hypothetical protein EXR71_02270 [Myxococcales bacterium]|nr:hypothetical protein [Myxococcales bacterium]